MDGIRISILYIALSPINWLQSIVTTWSQLPERKK